jgi:hypothetical protein
MAKDKNNAQDTRKKDEGEENEDAFHVVQHVGACEGRRGAQLHVDILRYKDNTAYIYCRRSGAKKDGSAWTGKMGGLDAEEARKLAPMLAKAAEALSTLNKG